MAATNESWQQVLDEADDGTTKLLLRLQLDDIEATNNNAKLLLQLQLEDLNATTDTTEEPRSADAQPSDFETSLSLYKTELELYMSTKALTAADLEPEPEGRIVLFSCVICEDRYDAEHCTQVPCQHYYCDGCLDDLFRAAMTHEQAYPPRCCRTTVPFEDVRHFLSNQLASEFAAKKEELDDTKRTYCCVPTCSTYISEGNKNGSIATCPACAAKTCILCKQAQHDGDCADDTEMAETMRLARSEGWQKCPQCERMVELNTGCNHMSCLCKAQFCYVCGETWRTCTCPHFHEARLIERGQQIVDREGHGDVNDMVNHLRNNHECDDHDWVFTRGRHECETCADTLNGFIFRCRRCREQICRRCMLTRA